MREYAENKGYEVVLDLGEVASGLSENRKKLWQALKMIKNGEADVLSRI